MTEQQGPREYQPFAPKQTICNGCQYLDKQGGMKGHRHVTDNYGCMHPEVLKENKDRSVFGVKGKLISFNKEYPCVTPTWCPFISKQKQDEKS